MARRCSGSQPRFAVDPSDTRRLAEILGSGPPVYWRRPRPGRPSRTVLAVALAGLALLAYAVMVLA